MKIKEIMTEKVALSHPQDSLCKAAQLMWENDCGSIPVVDSSRRIIGIVTDRDICMAAYTRGLPLGALNVDSTMSREVRTCRPTDSVGEVQSWMQMKQVHRLPVVDSESRVVGIVSLNDLALLAQTESGIPPKKAIDKTHVADTLAAIGAHRTAPRAMATISR